MTTLRDLLDVLGRTTWEPVWVPVLAWTVLALPLYLALERTDRLHPLAEYRLSQVLLAALPAGLLAVTLVNLLPGSVAVTPARSLSVTGPLLVEAPSGAEPSAPTWQWTQAVGLLTVGAALASLVRLGSLVRDAVATIRVRTSLDCAAPAPVRAHARRIARRLGLNRPVQVGLSPDAPVPLTLGGWAPTIVLPAGLAEDPDALRMTLVHECIHVRRYDDLAHLLEGFVAALFAAHPLVAQLREHVVEARERACDAAVLAENAHPPAEYARLLLSFAEGTCPQGLNAPALSESPSSLTTRLHAMRSSAPRWLSSPFPLVTGLLTLGIVVVFGVVACSDRGSPSTRMSDEPSAPTTVENVETPPAPRGGMQALRNEIQYPEMVKKAGIQGTVFVQFVVDENGQPQMVRVKDGVHRALDSAAVRAVRSTEFEPGRRAGSPVATQMTLPVRFKLPDRASPDAAEPSGTVEGSPPKGAPQIQGGMEALREQLTYPDIVREAGIEGRVYVTFTVTETGDVENARVSKGLHEALDAAALKAVQRVSFQPAQGKEGPTATEMTLPITFTLPNEEKNS